MVKEFLDKAISELNGLPADGLIFQSLREGGTSIEDVGELETPAGTTSERPTSFAQALLSKLNVSGDTAIASPVPRRNPHSRAISSISSIRSESSGPSRGTSPAKPEPSARNGASPSGRLPTRNGGMEGLPNGDSVVPDRTGPLLNYACSLIKENRCCQMDFGSLALLSDDEGVCAAARELNIPTKGISEIRHIYAERKAAEKQRNGGRDTVGEVDTIKDASSLQPVTTEVNGGAAPLAEEVAVIQKNVARVEELARNEITTQEDQIASQDDIAEQEHQAVKNGNGDLEKVEGVTGEAILPSPVEDVVESKMNGVLGGLDSAQENQEDAPAPKVIPPEEKTIVLAAPAQISRKEAPVQQAAWQKVSLELTESNNLISPTVSPPEDNSSDEEVVVFNPRSKRLSQSIPSADPPKIPQVPQFPKVLRQHEASPNGAPAVIDPDAFGRSFAKKPSGVALNAGRTLAARSPRASPRHSPQRSIVTSVPADVDFVLKSGSPRGAARGRGKLWVP